MKFILLSILSCLLAFQVLPSLQAQDYRWQQKVEYTMEIDLDVNSHQMKGTQNLVYFNNSNDTLNKVYYHLYFNAFQPGSMMDVRSRHIADPDPRVGSKISNFNDKEIGYHRIVTLHQDGIPVSHVTKGTLLEVNLVQAILPHTKSTFSMEFESQVPKQTRRSGRDNVEGVAYSMTQWYPKMAEYDFQGWHTNPYVGREFQSVWGNFDVKITLDSRYVIGGTGVLQNPNEIGYGYQGNGIASPHKEGKLSWHFVATNVHDFAWAADPEFKHDKVQVPDGPELHFFYQPGEKTKHWESELQKIGVKHFQYMNATYGKYPYSTYSVIQGGDGGMEYPMCTLILGEGSLRGTAGTMIHEIAHSWFQMVLGSNEAQYPWMDEGFTQFAAYGAESALFGGEPRFTGAYGAYIQLALSGDEEPASQFSDFYTKNRYYSVSAYLKGCVMLHQLKYIIGEENFWKGMKRYYHDWKFRHPEPIDFIRVMEKVSGMQLKWYLNYWIHTTKQIDYSVTHAPAKKKKTKVTLTRKGGLPMPIDLVVTYKDGSKELFYIPLNETLVGKPLTEFQNADKWRLKNVTELKTWEWVAPTYTFEIDAPEKEIARLSIDPSGRMADVHPEDNDDVFE